MKGIFQEMSFGDVALGHQRLSILDLSTQGRQPMSFEHIDMVYNGEIYNFREIRLELQELGYYFVSQTDSEVVLKAYHAGDLNL